MSPWGWTPGAATLAPAPSVVAVRVGTGLQEIVDALPTGGVLQLGAGVYYADNTDHTIPLIPPFPCSILGLSVDATTIRSPIWLQNSNSRLADFFSNPAGVAYGIKLYRPGVSRISRCRLDRIWCGATSEGAGDGPAKCLWLDGAEVCDYVNCVFAAGTDSNVFIDNTDSNGTNVNRFQGCTVNAAGKYGYEIVGGTVDYVEISGGNIESNSLAAIVATGMSRLVMRGIDFESSKVGIGSLIFVNGCGPVVLRDSSFFMTSPPTLGFNMLGCAGVRVSGNRFFGFNGGAVGVLDENSTGIIDPDNQMADGADRFLSHRGRLVSASI